MRGKRAKSWVGILVAGILMAGPIGPGAVAGAQETTNETAAEAVAPEAPRVRALHRVPRLRGEIDIDGAVDEEAWRDAAVIEVTVETRPAENTPAPVETRCLIGYDDRNVYIAFLASDPDPSAIRAHLSDRDAAFDDDFVGVILDTFNDERRAFEFFVNPLGVQMDLFNDEVGGSESATWDAIWESSGRVTADGYEVEMAIPFHQLRFPSGGGEQTWGFDAVRFYPRGDRMRLASQPLDRNLQCYLCQISRVSGFEGVSSGKNLELVPTLTSTRSDRREELTDPDLIDGDVRSDLGFTGRWGVTPGLTLNATLNPDFSQVEADVAQLDVNNTFALFFPERRPFFLEGADFFDTPIDAVFTRNVADPSWGGKLTGKVGRSAIGAFIARDEKTNLLFPGSQRSKSRSYEFETTDAVLRYRRDFGDNSALGALFTAREGGDYRSALAGIDGLWRFNDQDSVRFQWLRSTTEYPSAIAIDQEQPLGRFDDSALHINYNHDSRDWFAYVRHEDVGRDFRADLGFQPQVDYRLWLAGLLRNWHGEEDDWWNRFELGADWDLTEDQSGQLLEREVEAWVELEGPRQSFLWVGAGTRDRFFNQVTFDEDFVGAYFEMRPSGKFGFEIFSRYADEIDFDHTRPGKFFRLEPEVQWNIGKRTRLDLAYDYRRLDVEGGRLFEAGLTQLRGVYQINLRTFVRAILQYRDIDRDPRLFDREVSARFEKLFTQLLFSYKLNPQTVLFLGYADDREGGEQVDLTQTDRTVFFKLGYAFLK